MKTLLKVLFWIVGLAVMTFAFLILYATFSDYKPEKQEIVFDSPKTDVFPEWPEIDLMIWNIGYCGLSSDMDFFYDGGKKVRTSREQVLANLKNVISELQSNDTMEFFLLQEVDVSSKRSYGICEFDSIESSLPNYQSFFGKIMMFSLCLFLPQTQWARCYLVYRRSANLPPRAAYAGAIPENLHGQNHCSCLTVVSS
jgi:hypothetical protein